MKKKKQSGGSFWTHHELINKQNETDFKSDSLMKMVNQTLNDV